MMLEKYDGFSILFYCCWNRTPQRALSLRPRTIPELLDQALHRRFDDIMSVLKTLARTANQAACRQTDCATVKYAEPHGMADKIVTVATGLSAAEIIRACEEAAKEAILQP